MCKHQCSTSNYNFIAPYCFSYYVRAPFFYYGPPVVYNCVFNAFNTIGLKNVDFLPLDLNVMNAGQTETS